MLRKKAYPYEYGWEKFSETPRKDFYRHLGMEDISDADYAHAKIALNAI